MTTEPEAIPADVLELAKERAGWLVDAVAGSTQNRMFLRGEKEEDKVATESIYLSGKKAIEVAILADRASRAPVDGAGWQPIETAPNVKTILIHYAEGETEVVAADNNYFKWIPYDPDGLGNQPTHWMPLPAAPGTRPAPASPDAEMVRALRLAEHDQIDLLYHCRRHAEAASNDPDKYSMRTIRADRVEDRLKGTREVLSKHGGDRS